MDPGMHKLLLEDHKAEIAWRSHVPGVDGMDDEQHASFLEAQKARVQHENEIARAMSTPAKRKRFREQRLDELAQTVIKQEKLEEVWDHVHCSDPEFYSWPLAKLKERRRNWANLTKYKQYVNHRLESDRLQVQLMRMPYYGSTAANEKKEARKKEEGEAREKEAREAAVREAAEAREAEVCAFIINHDTKTITLQ
jgi:hypothetical protein